MLGKPRVLPNEAFFETVKALLDEGKQVRIPVKGKSMRPFLEDGDTVMLVSAEDRPIRWGTVVLARVTTGDIILHRVVFRNKNRLWLMGDAHVRQREQTTVENVLAIGKAESLGRRCVVVLWFLALPFRGYALRILDRLNRKNNKK
ncbi:MAG: S24/S26 family peptidase [Dysgonamonadaceae bacterium]|nr:S24/S26 family peptidase [Dysgonamonadaceae bacterium]